MTLLELLKEHLKEWPHGCHAFSQDSNGDIKHAVRDQDLNQRRPYVFDGWHMWVFGWFWSEWNLPVADDARTAIVTREMWEAV